MVELKVQEELRRRYNPDGSQLRKAQLRMLDMLKYLDAICRQNGLSYWIDSGTLIGAARHGGFIPWDDDVDICMPRKDMLKLEKILDKKKSKDFILQTPSNDPGFFNSGYVLRDLKSEYISNSRFHNRRKYKGLQIDIFPMEDHINYPLSRVSNLLHLLFIDKLCNTKTPNWIIAIFDRIIRSCIYPLFRFFCWRAAPLYRMDYGCGFKSIRYKKDIYPLKLIKFEGYNFLAPRNIDGYLTNIYGQWQVLPDNIQTHNVKILFY